METEFALKDEQKDHLSDSENHDENDIFNAINLNKGGELVVLGFWDTVLKQKKQFSIKKRESLELELAAIKKKKTPIGEIYLNIKDSISTLLFFIVLFALILTEVDSYSAYLSLPLFGYIIGRYFLPKKIKIIDKEKIKNLEENIELKAHQGFSNTIANKELLGSFKNEYGQEILESVFLESVKNQKVEQFSNAEPLLLEYNYQITVSELIERARFEDENKKNKQKVKQIVEAL